jgi:hypothetical protein
MLQQSTEQERFWDAAKDGDIALLLRYLVGASAEGFNFEKKQVSHRVKCPNFNLCYDAPI